MPGERPISSLILTELYEVGDASFVSRILAHRGSFKPLIGIIERWKKDRTATALRMKLEFVGSPLHPDHRVAFKRLFKQAWVDGDHALMGAFMVRLDRMIRRRRAKKYVWPSGFRGSPVGTEILIAKNLDKTSIFSPQTTHYLRRRAWRYFRRLGFSNPASYRVGIASALIQYSDADMRAGENLIDNWGLMHALFGKSELLQFNAQHTNLKPNASLANLQASPMFERHWQDLAAAADLMNILLRAQCRPVRVWAIQLLKRHHNQSLVSIDAETLLRLIDHQDEDVAAFAVELLSDATAVASMPVATWIKLLQTRNTSMTATIVAAFRKHVVFDRVTLEQSGEITINASTPVARLGLEILKTKSIRSAGDRAVIATLATSRCMAAGEEIAAFAISILDVPGAYQLDHIVGFLDARLLTIRVGAFAAITDQSPAAADPAFWSRLMESPYDDVKLSLVKRLQQRRTLPGATSDSLATLWQTVLLNIHRGGRAKLSALRQISDQIIANPANLRVLLPVIMIAIRSVRSPEASHGLSAIVRAIETDPTLADEVAKALPELQLQPAGGRA